MPQWPKGVQTLFANRGCLRSFAWRPRGAAEIVAINLHPVDFWSFHQFPLWGIPVAQAEGSNVLDSSHVRSCGKVEGGYVLFIDITVNLPVYWFFR